MTRNEILGDIRQTLGGVPDQFAVLPDSVLEHEWLAWKAVHIDDTSIPGKYKSLIGLAVAAALQNPHAQYAHREMAKYAGASEAEIIEALLLAKDTAGWSTFMAGAGIDLEHYEKSVQEQLRTLIQRKAA